MVSVGWKISVFDKLSPSDPLYSAIDTFVKALPADKTPDAFMGLAFDTVHILVEAMRSLEDPTDSAAVRDAIERTDGLVGATAVWSYSATNHRGNSTAGLVMSVLNNGRWEPVSS